MSVMEPLSCNNCCHNPLRAGIVGTDFGFCTRHGLVLLSPRETTCGQLLRKDLLVDRAMLLQKVHQRRFRRDRVASLYDDSAGQLLTEAPNGQLPKDAVIEESVAFQRYARNTKISSIAALRRLEGARADIAMTSLGRAYVQNCRRRDGLWKAGLHVLWWTLERLHVEPPMPEAAALHVERMPLERVSAMAKWFVITMRLYLVSDVGFFAAEAGDDAGALGSLADSALAATEPGDGPGLARWLTERRPKYTRALSSARYEQLARERHRER